MHFSSILITTDPSSFLRCVEDLESLPGVEILFRYPNRGRIVLTLEAATKQDHEEGLRRIRSRPGVQGAELVHRYQATGLTTAD